MDGEPEVNKSFINRVVVLGENTLIGKALVHALKEERVEVNAPIKDEVNIFELSSLNTYLDDIKPNCLINAFGYELIQDAEKNPDEAFRINRTLPFRLAKLLKEKNIFFITYSTDFVFDGKKDSPYTVEDKPNPKTVYGKSKLEGEKAILNSGISNFLIIRTSLLFGPWQDNFVEDILEMIKDRKKLFMVHDKIASPTYSLDLAKYSISLMKKKAKGIFHLCNSGQASWCELAAQVVNIVGSRCKIEPTTSDHSLASYPAYSVLDTSKFYQLTRIKPRSWIQALQEYLFYYHSSYFEEE